MFNREFFKVHANQAHGVVGGAPSNIKVLLLHLGDEFLGQEFFEAFFPNVLKAFSLGWADIPRASPEECFLRIELHHFEFGFAGKRAVVAFHQFGVGLDWNVGVVIMDGFESLLATFERGGDKKVKRQILHFFSQSFGLFETGVGKSGLAMA